MEAIASPRITCAYLNTYVGKNVIIVGKVIQLRGEEALIDADGNITAHLNRVSSLTPHPFRSAALAQPLLRSCDP
jgi:replication factor A3